MMVIDMTAQLAPIGWGVVALLAISGASILASALPEILRKRSLRTARRAKAVGLVGRPATT